MTKPKKEKEGKLMTFSDMDDCAQMIPSSIGGWKVYDQKMLYSTYIVTVDLSEGKYADKDRRDLDFTVGVVWKLQKPVEEVAFFRDKIPPEIMAEQVACVAKYFNNALVMPELNGPGLAFLVRLRQIYSNIYREQRYSQGSFVMTDDYGFRTTSTNKPRILGNVCSQIRDADKGMVIHSDIIRKEMSKYAQDGIRYEALYGHHDDTITNLWLMAAAIAQNPGLIEDRIHDRINGIGNNLEKPIERDYSWQWMET